MEEVCMVKGTKLPPAPPPYHTSVLIHSCQPCRRIFVNGSQTKVRKKKNVEEYIHRSVLICLQLMWFFRVSYINFEFRYKLLQSRLCIDLSKRFISKQWKNRTLAPILLLSFLSACFSNDYKNVFPHCCLSVPLILTII